MKSHEKSTGQKAALVGLLFLGVFALGLGFFKVRSQIAGPFVHQISRAQDAQLEQFFEQQQQQEESETLKNRDTDGDGLSDYDELNIHKTSPYLKDTDSDTYDDATEIKSGHDPNCAIGKVCAPVIPTTPETESGTDSLRETEPDTVSALEQDLKKLESLTPAQVRELLKQKGFTDTDLADVDDEALQALYRESLEKALELEKQKETSQNSTSQLGGVPGATSAQKTQEQLQQELANLTKPQIIKMLTDTGELPQEYLAQLEQLDEQQLKQLFYQALQQAQANYDAKRQ